MTVNAIFDIFGRVIECSFDRQTGNVVTAGQVSQRELDEIIRLFKLADFASDSPASGNEKD